MGVSANAQIQHFSSQSLGMGGGGTAYQDGYHANFVNPANLMLKRHRRPNTSVGLANTGFRAGGGMVNIPVYNQYLTKGLTLDGEIRENFLTDYFGSANDTDLNDLSLTLDVIPFAFSNRGEKSAFSLAVRSRVLSKSNFSRGFLELGLYGLNADQFGSPTAVNFLTETVAFGEVSIGYAREILKMDNLLFAKNIRVYAGVAPKILIAAGYANLNFESTFQVNRAQSGAAVDIIHDFNYSLNTYGELGTEFENFEAARANDPNAPLDDYLGDGSYVSPAFAGIAWDFGGTAEMDISGIPFLDMPIFGKKTLTVGISFTDIGAVKFDDAPVRVFNDDVFQFSGAPSGEDVGDFYDNLADSTIDPLYLGLSVEDADEIRYALPGSMNLGAHLQMGKLGASIDYSAGFNGKATNSQFSTLVLGAEYRFFNFLPLRVGVRNGGFTSRVYTAGFGLDLRFLELTFAAALPSKGDRNGSGMASAFSGLNFRF